MSHRLYLMDLYSARVLLRIVSAVPLFIIITTLGENNFCCYSACLVVFCPCSAAVEIETIHARSTPLLPLECRWDGSVAGSWPWACDRAVKDDDTIESQHSCNDKKES